MDKSREWAEADGRSSNANPSWLVWRESRKVQLKIRSSNDEIWRKAEQFERVRRIDEKIFFFSLSLSTKNPCSHFKKNDSSISNRSNFLTILSRRVSKDFEGIFQFSSRKRT